MITQLTMMASALSLNCTVEPPQMVFSKEGAVSTPQIGLPPELSKWNFGLTLRPEKNTVSVELDWQGDPIRAGNALAAFPIGPHDYAFVSLHGGPCLFTKTSCLFMYTVSEQADGTADILIQPAALASNEGRSKPFQVFLKGRCVPKGKTQ